MAPKPKPAKEVPKRAAPSINRPPISSASLVLTPQDAVEGYQERIEEGVAWILSEQAARHHRNKRRREDIPSVPFSVAMENKIKKSIIFPFMDESSSMSLEEHWNVSLPIAEFEIANSANEEDKICHRNINLLTDNLIKIIKKAVRADNRKLLRKELKKVQVLRVNDSKMTTLDSGISNYKDLVSLSLCGNYIEELESLLLPSTLKILELQSNWISSLNSFHYLPTDLMYLGLARNLLTDDGLHGLSKLPHFIAVLDLSDNDIYHLLPLLTAIRGHLKKLTSLSLAGNPCAMCMGYARTVLTKLRHLKYLDNREILDTDRPNEEYDFHEDDLRSNYFTFRVLRIISAPCPPKPDKGATATFHVEMELPLLDAQRRQFLMYRRTESLEELEELPVPEAEDGPINGASLSAVASNKAIGEEEEVISEESDGDIFNHLEPKNSRLIRHYTVFESNKVPWSKQMNFQEPTIKIFCPDLVAIRNTFRSTITIRLIYTLLTSSKGKEKGKTDKSQQNLIPPEQTKTIATIKCSLRRCDWSQYEQHFHWDETMDTDEAIHWGDGDLAILQYLQSAVKSPKGKAFPETTYKQSVPEYLTCHFAFGLDNLHL